MNSIQKHKSDAELFIEMLNQAKQGLVEACKFAVAALERDPGFIDKVCDLNPDITDEAVRRCIAIGMGSLHPDLCFSEAPGVRRLRRLPMSVQEKYVKAPVEVLLSSGDTLMIDVRNLTPSQASQAFASDHPRSVAEQRAWLEDQAIKLAAPKPASDMPWRITGKGLVILEPCQFTRKEVARILADMEA